MNDSICFFGTNMGNEFTNSELGWIEDQMSNLPKTPKQNILCFMEMKNIGLLSLRTRVEISYQLILRPVNFRSHLQYEIILLISWDISSQSLIKWNPIIVIGSSPILNFSLKIRPFQHKRAWEETIVSCKYRTFQV